MKFFNRNHFKYALIFVAVLVSCLILMELTGNNRTFDNKSPVFLAYQFLAPAIIWYFGIRAKKIAQHNKLTFKEGVLEGFKFSLVFGLISPFVFVLYYILINPPILNYIKSSYNLTGVSDITIILIDMAAQFIFSILFGTIYAAVISFFLKNKKS